MKERLCALALILTIALASCNLPTSEQATPTVPDAVFTQAAETIVAELTQAALLESPTPTSQTETLTPSPTSTSTFTLTPTLTTTLTPTNTFTPINANMFPNRPNSCNQAYFVDDITYDDYTVVPPGLNFTKTWRLRNVGTCTWNSTYRVAFDRNTGMGVPYGYSQPFASTVFPGQNVDISVNLSAPTAIGTYRGDWSLRDPNNQVIITFVVVIRVAEPITITADTPDPSVPGQPVAVSVTVSGAWPVPTGTVAITGADTNCTVSLVNGSGSCNVIFNTIGTKTLTATYSGDAYHSSSVGTTSHTVSQGVTTTTISADTPDPSTPGQSVAVSVSVSGSGTNPTGTVSITGADTNCSITLSSGSGSCNVVFNTVGSKTLTATYNGDTNYSGSSDTESHTVATTTTSSTTNITGDVPDSSTPGQSVTVGVTVSGTGATPTGTVAITGADTNCTITLAGGSGSCNVLFNTTGAKTILATYSGDSNYASSSDTESHTVSQGPSTTTITADAPDPSTPGQSVAISVNVSGAGTTPTGTVIITGADTNCTVTLSSGSGSCNVVFNTVGTKTLTATYSGDMNYVSSSGTASHTVSVGPSTVSITSDLPDPSAAGGTVTVTVTVSGAGATPTGTVTITGADSPCTITLVGGTGSCDVVFSSTGTFTLTATYSGDSNYASNSDTESHTVS